MPASAGTNRKLRRALVTGAAGFIGSHLTEALLKQEVSVVAFDDYSAGKPENLSPFRGMKNFEEIRGDVTDAKAVNAAMQRVDTVFHQAASKKTVCMRDPFRDLEVNAGGSLRLLQAAVGLGVKKCVHASTGTIYGEPITMPQNEQHRLQPVSYYGVSKLAGESYVNTFAALFGIDATILRYFHDYGPRQESSDVGGVVSILLRRALSDKPLLVHGDGKQMRPFTWVGDIVEADIRSATMPIARGKTYNYASGIRVTVNELAAMVLKRVNPKTTITHGDPLLGDIREFDVDDSLIKRDLGLEFVRDFEHGLNATLDWALAEFAAKQTI